MSRLAKKPIQIPEGVNVKKNDGELEVGGAKGDIKVKILPFLKVEVGKENSVTIDFSSGVKQAKINAGTMAALVRNAIAGVAHSFLKVLEMEGVGYRANMEGKTLVLSLGFVNPVKYNPPEGVNVSVEKNVIKVEGIDKALVGRAAAEIRAFKKPEPYKGKGIHYQGEVIKRKAGKKAVATA